MIAHIRKSDYKTQTVQQHSENVSSIAGKFGVKVGLSSMAELTGFLHDMGKSTIAFSTYIKKAVQGEEVLEKIDHSTAGAKYLYENYYVDKPETRDNILANLVTEVVGMSILSHHSGLQNFVQVDGGQSDFFRRVCKKNLPYYEEVCSNFFSTSGNKERVNRLFHKSMEEMGNFIIRLGNVINKQGGNIPQFIYYSLATKFIFSCLIDADRTDARRFDEGDTSKLFCSHQSFFKESYNNLLNQLKKWAEQPASTNHINKLRSKMSKRCDDLAEMPSSIFKLTVPTGGGKTLASLRYALKHAQKYNKDRIIYVVPYTTILEQNADAVRGILKSKESVLEHHANVMDGDNIENDCDFYCKPFQKTPQLARDNYDHPIIFTTMVQFLDSFYARGTRKTRRMHNLTNAIIIFDEVQSVPVNHIPLFNSAVNFLHHFGNSSILLCTATQPSLAKTEYPLLIEENTEMVDNLPRVTKAFERVRIINKVSNQGWSTNKISEFTASEIKDRQSILIILNTKKAVLEVYRQLREIENCKVYHLSTSMCPQHRKDILKEIVGNLQLKKEKIICISTQLIEAGVDISFECVIRSLAGLDSIAQAAGRCNRNGELKEKGIVYIIKSKDENLTKLPEISIGQTVTEEDILSRGELAENLLSSKAIQTYFDFYLNHTELESLMTDPELNIPLIQLLDRCPKYVSAIPKQEPRTIMCSMFKTLGLHFQVIESNTTGVLVPYNDEAKEIIAILNEEVEDYTYLNMLLKRAQLYTVNLYSHTLHQLAEEDLLYRIYNKDIFVLRDIAYHIEYGLSIDAEGTWDLPIF